MDRGVFMLTIPAAIYILHWILLDNAPIGQ